MIKMRRIITYLKNRESEASKLSSLAPSHPSPLHYALKGIDRNNFAIWVADEEKNKKNPLTKDQIEYAINDCLSSEYGYIENGINNTLIRTTTKGRKITQPYFGLLYFVTDFIKPFGILGGIIMGIVGIISLGLAWGIIPSLSGSHATSTTPIASNNNLGSGAINNGAMAAGAGAKAVVNNINQESGYTWTNKDAWAIDTQFCNNSVCKYDVRLFFKASGPVVPIMSCLKIKTNSHITSFAFGLWDWDETVSNYFSKNNLKSGIACVGSELGTTPEIRVGFFDKPTTIDAELINCKDTGLTVEGCK